MSKRRNREEEKDFIITQFQAIIAVLALGYLTYLYKFHYEQFLYIIFVYVLPIIVILTGVIIYKVKKRKKLFQQILNDVELDIIIQKFILSFGHNRSKTAWEYRGYTFEEKELEDFSDQVIQRGFKISKNENAYIKMILEEKIDSSKKRYQEQSLGTKITHNYNELSNTGVEFEELIVRLYDGMGYQSKRIGGTGDYGGDVLAAKSGDTLIIQAKFYEKSVGIKAVQEALGAREKYNCSSAVVITTGTFTREALELAKITNIELIDNERLNQMLVEYLHETWN